ncbi:MAG: DUF58 domain-containing protein [Oscillospiraceae bacterium]|nr:DUF58 domain-containing protein [Oscillospiraceae bacterium]MBR2423091.1 DUF58 domain-containing protein [Oscillospiraceae bacterium]
MIVLKLSWLVLEGLLLWFFLYYGSGVALALGMGMFLIPLISLPVDLYLKKQLNIRIEAAVSQRKGDDGSIVVTIQNPTRLPVLRIRCDVVVQNQLNREKHSEKLLTYALPKRKQKNTLRLGSEYCGRIRIAIPKVTLYDCFGLIGIRYDCKAVAHMTVQPDTFETAVILVPNLSSSDDSELYSQERPGMDLTETYQIREYVPGDSIRQIHWKLSNKFDKLIVRDPGLPITRNVLVFWERTGESGDPDIIDAQAEVIISLCRSLMDSGIQFNLGWNDTDRNLCVLHEIRDMDELVGVIPRLLRATGAQDSVSGAALLLQTRPEVLCAHMVYLAETPQSEVVEMQRYGHVTMLVCGEAAQEDAILFNEEDYSHQLTQIEI